MREPLHAGPLHFFSGRDVVRNVLGRRVGAVELGTIRPRRLLARRAAIVLSKGIPREVRLFFFFFLAAIVRRRAANGSAA